MGFEAAGGIAFWVLCMTLVVLMVGRSERGLRRSKQAFENSEESLVLARQQIAMQTETNRLLGQLIDKLDRDRETRSSHD
jgi:hypothetical protein